MPRIGQSDQVLLLLQEQLAKLGKQRAERRVATNRPPRSAPDALIRASTLATRDDMPEDDRRRVVIRGLLIQHMGEPIANDPAFDAIINNVTRVIADSEEGRALLDAAWRALGSTDAD